MGFGKTIKELEKNFDKKKIVFEKDVFSKGGEKIVYVVFTKNLSPLNFGLTVLNAGDVGGEFYMTRGHVHGSKMQEFYILLEGMGKLLLQKSGKVKVVNMKKGELVLIPVGFAHRLVNTGKKKMKVLTVYHQDSKPKYGVRFKKRVTKPSHSHALVRSCERFRK